MPPIVRIRGLLIEGSTLMTEIKLNYLLTALSPDAVTWRVRASTHKFWGTWFSP